MCFHNPPNSDGDYRILNVLMWFFCMGDFGFYSHPKDFCKVCIGFDSGEISGWAQSPACNCGPSIGWPCSVMPNFGFRERGLSLCATDCLHKGLFRWRSEGKSSRKSGLVLDWSAILGMNVFVQLVASVFGQGSFRSKYKGESSRSLNRVVVFHQRFHS